MRAHNYESVENFDENTGKRIRISGLLCYLCGVIPLIAAFFVAALIIIFENGKPTIEELFEMTVNITIYSAFMEIVGIGVIILQILIVLSGLRILVRQTRTGKRILSLTVIFLTVAVVIDPIFYYFLAKGINWGLLGSVGDVSELIRLALFDPSLLSLYLCVIFITIGYIITFTTLLLILDGKTAVKRLKTAGFLYLVQIAVIIFQIFMIMGLPYSIYRILTFSTTMTSLLGFLIL